MNGSSEVDLTISFRQSRSTRRSRDIGICLASIELQDFAEELAAVAFSLWRAVFLSDLLAGDERRLSHLDLFLESLIADNTVVYATDKRSREWTFRYYMSNARFRLLALAGGVFGHLVDKELLQSFAPSKKDEWSLTQRVLGDAITALGTLLRERAPKPPPA